MEAQTGATWGAPQSRPCLRCRDMTASDPAGGLRIAYLCLQATLEGQASYAHVFEIVAGLRGKGHFVEVFSPSYPENGRVPGPIRRLWQFLIVQVRLVRVLSEFDVLYIRSHPLALPVSAEARRARIPVVQECNGPYGDFYLAWPTARFFRFVLEPAARWQYRSAHSVIAVTDELADWVDQEASRNDTQVVPSGANIGLFRPDAPVTRPVPAKYVVFFGALAPWQGIDMMLDAVASPEWPKGVPLVVAGDGRLRDRIVSASAGDDRVVYLGSVPYEEMGGIVAHSLVSLVTKQVPPEFVLKMSPLKLFESMAAGVPVIVSDFEDLVREVEPAGAGIVVPQDDPAALARAVAWLDRHPAEAREMGSRGRAQAVARHSWFSRAEQTARIVEAAAS